MGHRLQERLSQCRFLERHLVHSRHFHWQLPTGFSTTSCGCVAESAPHDDFLQAKIKANWVAVSYRNDGIRVCVYLWTTCVASRVSSSESTISLTTHRISKRERIGSVSSTFSLKCKLGLYRPPLGLAAAITAHLAERVALIPALEMLICCCSMASCRLVLSWSLILSNSSIKQIPFWAE